MVGGYPPRRWGRARVELFAVEPRAVQLTWVGLADGEVRVRVGERSAVLTTSGGFPGGVALDDLSPATSYRIDVESAPTSRRIGTESAPRTHRIGVESAPRGWRFDVQTPDEPPGRELFRLATVSDVHIGLDHFGLSRRMEEREAPTHPYAERCFRAALAEAREWGAEFLVVKGDLVERGTPDEWAVADRLLAEAGVPTAIVPGNHEVKPYRTVEPPTLLPQSGAEITHRVTHHDLPGLRLVLVNSTVDGEGHGAVAHLTEEVAATLRGTEARALVTMHQHPQRFEFPWFWPPGIPGREARRFLDAIAAANPRTLVTSGHTHRNRSRKHGPITITEVGSTKDFPGAWAGYTVYEGGLTQTVRRTLAPEAMGWTEYTRRAVLGIWGLWSPGRLADRCVVLKD